MANRVDRLDKSQGKQCLSSRFWNVSRMVHNFVMTRNILGYSHLNTWRCLLKIHSFLERANARTVRTVQDSRERPSERGSSGQMAWPIRPQFLTNSRSDGFLAKENSLYGWQ